MNYMNSSLIQKKKWNQKIEIFNYDNSETYDAKYIIEEKDSIYPVSNGWSLPYSQSKQKKVFGLIIGLIKYLYYHFLIKMNILDIVTSTSSI